MDISDIKPGVSIRHKQEYEGEGEYLIVEEINQGTNDFKCIMACCEKYPALNGMVTYVDVFAALNYFEIV